MRADGLIVLEVLRPTRQVRRMDGKSDPVDAIAAARQVLTGDGTSTPKHTDTPVEALRYLLVTRRNLIGAISRLITVIAAGHRPRAGPRPATGPGEPHADRPARGLPPGHRHG